MKNYVGILLLSLTLCLVSNSARAAETTVSEEALKDSLTVAYGDVALKHYEAAMAKYRSILALDPENVIAKYYMSYLKVKQGKWDEGYALVKKVADDYPDWAPGNIQAGWYAFLVKKFKEAKEYNDKALKLDSANLAVRVNTGHLLLAQGKTKEAEACYLAAIKEMPSRKAFERHFGEDLEIYLPKILKADVLKKEKKWIESEFARQEKSWRKNDEAAKTLGGLADEAYEANNYKEAAAQIEKLLALTPDNPTACLMLAECWKQLGDKEKHMLYLGKTLEIDDEFPVAFLNFGITQYNDDQYLAAINNLRCFQAYDEHRSDEQSLKAEELIAKSWLKVANHLLEDLKDYDGARAIFHMMLDKKMHLYPSQSRSGMLVLVHDDPKGDAFIKTAIARSYVLQERGAEAKPYLQEAMELDAENADVYFLQGIIALQAGNNDLCFEKLKKAARLGSEEAKSNLEKNGVEY